MIFKHKHNWMGEHAVDQTGIILVKQPSHVNELPVVEACKLVLIVSATLLSCMQLNGCFYLYREIFFSQAKYIIGRLYIPGISVLQ